MYCPHCGNETEGVIAIASPAAEAVSAEVEIARINAERDVKVAQITARQERDYDATRIAVAEVEGEAQVATAEAEAEIIGEILAGETEDEQETGEPIVIEAPEPEPEPEPDVDAPPVVETSAPAGKKSGGYWGAYR